MIKKSNIIAIIPARLASTRLERKMLQDLGGKSVIQRTYEAVAQAGIFDELMIAADDREIVAHCQQFGANVMMTAIHHQSGTDRIAELAKTFDKNDIIINVQGDEPFINIAHLRVIVDLFEDEKIRIASLYSKINSQEELMQNSVVKVCLNINHDALLFSRSPIPYLRNSRDLDWTLSNDYYRHIGIYGFRNETLQQITKLSPSKLELAESLEQLRWLENNYKIRLAIIENHMGGIDTMQDLIEARNKIASGIFN